MRDKYYTLITSNGLPDVFTSLYEMSYSTKYNILTELLERYSIDVLTKALFEYQRDYIFLNRVKISLIKNHLIYLCKNA